MPLPTSLVEKNGSQILSRMCSGTAGVLDLEGIFAGRHQIGSNRARGLGAEIIGAHRQRAAVGHRIAGIDSEVDDDLLNW